MKGPLVIAHRGASHEAPENTLAAIRKAIGIADFIEIDVHLSQDNIPIVIHDATLWRTTDAQDAFLVKDLAIENLRKLDAGSWFDPSFSKEKIPLLEEVMALDFGSTGLMLELKEDTPDFTILVRKTLECLSLTQCKLIAIGSFSSIILQEVHQLYPYLPLIGIAETQETIESFKGLNLFCLALDYQIITPKLLKQPIPIWAFTIDDPLIAQELIERGVQGIITNNPVKIACNIYPKH